MFFRGTDENARTLSGKRFPQPALVWRVTGQDLFLRALKHSRRPTGETQLMVALYWNVRGEDADATPRIALALRAFGHRAEIGETGEAGIHSHLGRPSSSYSSSV